MYSIFFDCKSYTGLLLHTFVSSLPREVFFSHPCRKDGWKQQTFFCETRIITLFFSLIVLKSFKMEMRNKRVMEEEDDRDEEAKEFIERERTREEFYALRAHTCKSDNNKINIFASNKNMSKRNCEEVSVYINSSRGKSKILSVLF